MKSATHLQSDTQPGTLNHGLEFTRIARAYLKPSLPVKWDNYFHAIRAGRYWGLRIECPACQAHPPRGLKGNQRWRWMSVHQAGHRSAASTK